MARLKKARPIYKEKAGVDATPQSIHKTMSVSITTENYQC